MHNDQNTSQNRPRLFDADETEGIVEQAHEYLYCSGIGSLQVDSQIYI